MTNALIFLTVISLGLMAGALLAEAALLVPFWRSLAPNDFLAWYRAHAGLLLGFFAPLEVVTTLATTAAAVASWNDADTSASALAASAVLCFVLLAMFPAYFQRANASFAEATIDAEHVPAELRRWARWHWLRVLIAVVAFSISTVAAAG